MKKLSKKNYANKKNNTQNINKYQTYKKKKFQLIKIKMSSIIKLLCNYFMEGYCDKGKQCKFIHDSYACKYYYFDGYCDDKECDYEHYYI